MTRNKFFNEEFVSENDLFYTCFIIEKTARSLKQRNSYVVNAIGKDELWKILSLANVLHCQNHDETVNNLINEYNLEKGEFDISAVNPEYCSDIPAETEMGKVYARLVINTLLPDETYQEGIIRVYNNKICDTIDNYNCSAYYEPSYVIERAYNNGTFQLPINTIYKISLA